MILSFFPVVVSHYLIITFTGTVGIQMKGTTIYLKLTDVVLFSDQTDQVETIEVKGRDLVTGIPKILTIDSDEIRKSISEQVETIVETVRIALEQTPPELAADIVDTGIVLTGGGSLLKNLDILLREETKLPITITEDPLSTVVIGSGKALDNISVLKEVMIK